MKQIEFAKLYELDYNLSDLLAIRQFWKDNFTFRMNSPRRTSCLLYFCGSSAIYKLDDGEELSISRGSIVYIPEGSVYESTFFECDSSLHSTILLEFSLNLPCGDHFRASERPYVLTNKSNVSIDDLFNEATELFSAAVISLSKIKSLVYRLLSDLSHTERQQSIHSRGFHTISQGIAHLENDLRSKKTVKEIAEMCHVSESTFRRLFKQYTGKSPAEYRIERRIMYAKKLLSTESMTVIEVSIETGFDDPAYFCRVFKKHTGITAGEYLRSLQNY